MAIANTTNLELSPECKLMFGIKPFKFSRSDEAVITATCPIALLAR